MSLITILMTMSITSFSGLRNTVRMNEYMLNLEQDIRNVQRSAMLVERNPQENWIYGLGIDFSTINDGDTLGHYTIFKWCSPFFDYGDITTRSPIPGFDPNQTIIEGMLPTDSGNFGLGICDSNSIDPLFSPSGELFILSGFSKPLSPPVSSVVFSNDIRFILFESISGRAFFYNTNGDLQNYTNEGVLLEDDILHFGIEFTPVGRSASRKITVSNLSGKINTHMFE